MSDRERLLKKLSGAQFAALEMQLYLDTHKNDASALKSMQEYLRQAKEYRKEYEERFGPITPNDLYGDTTFNWLNAPWPWEHESEAKK
ncbi:MAG: spore coat protein CotJB [Clostridia bacterium]|nr:spore coat protein CotJB [Clostridia bacterium]